MVTVMRCHTPHWQGNTFIEAGALRPAGHAEVIPIYFDVYTVAEEAVPAPPPEPVAAEEPKRGPGRPRKTDA